MLYMFGELVWLRLRHLSPSRHLSSHSISTFSFLRSMSLRRLRVLEIQSSGDSIEGFFDNFHHELPQLNELNIVYTEPKTNWREHVWRERRELIRVLRGLSGLSSIEVASSDSMSPKNTKSLQQRSSLIPRSRQNESSFFRYLEHWVTGTKTLTTLVLKNLGFLQSLPIDFSQLQNLIHLDLSGCSQLTELPNTFSKLLQLQYLALQDCFKLSIPLDILGEISTLEYVDFKGCAKLVCLPEGIPYQRNLRYLNLLGTGLLQLPNNLAILDKLQQITIGSPTLKEIPLTLANLKGLTELFLIQCPGLQRILPEGIAAPNIKILAIDGCPIANFSFQDQGNLDVENMHLRVGMSLLRDFILTNTSISQISIPDCVAPMLETIDLSENIRLMCVNALPSALVNLNLQNCCGLKTLTSLSNLVNLKFLNINKCFNLKTLNMEGLASLEEIKAEECWELQRIEGLNQRERLNCLHISTDNRVIWNGICRFLRSPTHQQPSTAIFSGRADDYKSFDKRDMLRIAEKFNLQMLDMVFKRYTTVFSFQRLENFHSHGAILLCFNTANEFKSRHFRVTFTPIGHGQSTLQYSTITGNRGGRGVHLFMWTEKSRLFKKYSVYGDIWVICSHDYRTEEASSSSVEEERGFMGWILMVDKKTDVSEVCREFIMACA